MDAALKARNLGSATKRRQRNEERQKVQHTAFQERQARKQQIMAMTLYFEDSGDESDTSMSTCLENGSAAETPSEYSVRTPRDMPSPELDQAALKMELTLDVTVADSIRSDDDLRRNLEEMGSIRRKPRSMMRPKMHATLAKTSDFAYDRFSTILDASPIEDESASSDDEDENVDEDTYSPLEIATPVAYSMPKARPSVISISSSPQYSSARSLSLRSDSLFLPPSTFLHTSRSLVTHNPRLSSLSAETRPVIRTELDEKPAAYATASSGMSLRDFDSNGNNGGPQKKSSMPSLFSTNRNGHSRMSSLKKVFRVSTLGSSRTVSPAPPSPRTPLATHFEYRRSITDPFPAHTMAEFQRPKTSYVSTVESSPPDITALPQPPSTLACIQPIEPPTIEGPTLTRTKSFSKLRQRSGSFGQALKFRKTPMMPDESAPPVPSVFVGTPDFGTAADAFPAPPPLTPRYPRRSMAPFPPTAPSVGKRSSAAVGLGLKQVHGL